MQTLPIVLVVLAVGLFSLVGAQQNVLPPQVNVLPPPVNPPAGFPPSTPGGINNGQGSPGAFPPRGGKVGAQLLHQYGPPEWRTELNPFRSIPTPKVLLYDDDSDDNVFVRHRDNYGGGAIVFTILAGLLLIALLLLIAGFLVWWFFPNREEKRSYRTERSAQYDEEEH